MAGDGIGAILSGIATTARPIVLFVGNYGSGKTEVAVNFSIHAAQAGQRVRIADLDLVNPYFRCREAREAMEAHQIEVILPDAEYLHADLPILVPSVKGMIQQPDGLAVLDVGGDDVGATVLASLRSVFPEGGYDLLLVVNRSRPFTDTAEGVRRIKGEIEAAARMAVTGLVANTHLMDDTTAELIHEGLDLTREVGEACELPVAFVTAEEWLVEELDEERLGGIPVLPIRRRLLPPWRRGGQGLGSSNFRLSGRM